MAVFSKCLPLANAGAAIFPAYTNTPRDSRLWLIDPSAGNTTAPVGAYFMFCFTYDGTVGGAATAYVNAAQVYSRSSFTSAATYSSHGNVVTPTPGQAMPAVEVGRPFGPVHFGYEGNTVADTCTGGNPCGNVCVTRAGNDAWFLTGPGDCEVRGALVAELRLATLLRFLSERAACLRA